MIDGATGWQGLRHITLPMLTPYIFFNLIMGIIGTLQIFTQAYIMTSGAGCALAGRSFAANGRTRHLHGRLASLAQEVGKAAAEAWSFQVHALDDSGRGGIAPMGAYGVTALAIVVELLALRARRGAALAAHAEAVAR